CAPRLESLLAEAGLVPQAVFLTHGHPDHILGLNNVLARWNVPVHLGGPDRYRLQDPASTLSPQFAPMLAPLVEGWTAPEASEPARTRSASTGQHCPPPPSPRPATPRARCCCASSTETRRTSSPAMSSSPARSAASTCPGETPRRCRTRCGPSPRCPTSPSILD